MDAPLAIVMAAGQGTRMNSLLPKVMCQAAGRPLISYVIDALREAGVERIVVVVGYEAEMVKSGLAHYENLQFAQQTKQLGTGHAVMMCRGEISDHDGPIVIVAGDSPMLQSSSIRALLDEFNSSRPAGILGTLMCDDPTGLGRICRDPDGRFFGIVEQKDATVEQLAIKEVNLSTYVFDCRPMVQALEKLTDNNQQKEYYITDIPGILLKEDRDVRALPVLKPIEALSVNTPEHLADVEREMLRKQ